MIAAGVSVIIVGKLFLSKICKIIRKVVKRCLFAILVEPDSVAKDLLIFILESGMRFMSHNMNAAYVENYL